MSDSEYDHGTTTEPPTRSHTTMEPEPKTQSITYKEPERETVKYSVPTTTSIPKTETNSVNSEESVPETSTVIKTGIVNVTDPVPEATPHAKSEPEIMIIAESVEDTTPITKTEPQSVNNEDQVPETVAVLNAWTEAHSVANINEEDEPHTEPLIEDNSNLFPEHSGPPEQQLLHPQNTVDLDEAGPNTAIVAKSLNPPIHEGDQVNIRVSVTSPVKHTVNGRLPGFKSSYHTYLINTTTSLETFHQQETVVRRRFREFVDLGNLLKVNFCGFFVPPRPHRNWYQGKVLMRKRFIEERRVLLERYLRGLAAHPKISTSTELRVFLESKGNLSTTFAWRELHEQGPTLRQITSKTLRQISGRERITPDASEISKPRSLNRNVMWVIGGSMKNLELNRQPISYSSQEQTLRDERRHMLNFKTEVVAVWKRASVWIEGIDKMSQMCKNLALELKSLTQFETDARYLRFDVGGVIGNGADQASEVYALSLNESAGPLSVVHNYVEMMKSVLGALASREKALKNVHIIDQGVNRKQARLDQLHSKSAKPERIAKLEADIEADKKSLFEAKKFHEHVTIVNTEEANRFRTTRAEDWTKMIVQLAQIQHKCYVQLTKVWIGVSEKLGTDPNELTEIKAVVKGT